jgi:peptidyl-prolyl cis-trans isomerase C/foldase protein PrsA
VIGRAYRGGPSALAALGLLVFFPACRRAPEPAAPAPRAAALVNGVPIPLSRVQAELDRMRQGSEDTAAKIAPQEIPRLARALLDALIDRAIVLQRAKASGFSVSEAEVQRATDTLAEDARKGGAAWGDQLARAGLNPEQLSDDTRERLLAEKYVADQTRAERASPAEIRAYYDTHKALFEVPEAVHCLQIALRTPEEAKSVLDQLRAGAPFDKVARQAGTTPDARNGGDLGWFSKGTMPKVFDDTCFSLQTNKLSGVVASPYGYHVFKVLGRRGPRTRKFEEVKGEAERQATAEKRAQAERQLLQQLRSAAQVKIDDGALALLK